MFWAGKGRFEGTILTGPPGPYSLWIKIKNLEGEIVMSPAEIKVEVDACRFGEYLGEDGHTCTKCAEGEFNPGVLVRDCQPCPKHAICNGSIIVPENGFWHDSCRSQKIQLCSMPKACIWENRLRELSNLSANMLYKNLVEHQQPKEYTGRQCREVIIYEM